MEVGQRLPEILGKDQDGKELKLSDFKGKKLVLYVYPKDFLSLGYVVIGVSIQDESSHKKFIAK